MLRIAKFANLPAIFHCPSVADGAIKLCVWQRGYRPLWGQDVITPEIPMAHRLNITLKMCKKWFWHLCWETPSQSTYESSCSLKTLLLYFALNHVKPNFLTQPHMILQIIAIIYDIIHVNGLWSIWDLLLVPFPSCPVLAPPQLPVTKWLGNFWPSAGD